MRRDLADTWGVAEEDLEPSAGFAGFLRGDAAEELFRVRTGDWGSHRFMA